jgi:hypothetical protein
MVHGMIAATIINSSFESFFHVFRAYGQGLTGPEYYCIELFAEYLVLSSYFTY